MDNYKQARRLAIFKTLANAHRINILKTIGESSAGSLNVNEIAAKVKLSQPKVSDHLKLMRLNRVLKAKQIGTTINYSLKEPVVMKLITMME